MNMHQVYVFSFTLLFLVSSIVLINCYEIKTPIFSKDNLRHASVFGTTYGDVTTFTVVNGSDQFVFDDADNVVTSVIQVDNNNTGWAYLVVHTSDLFDDVVQAYWAGYTEGLVSSDLTQAHFINTAQICKKPYNDVCVRTQTYITKNWEWMKQQVVTSRSTSPFWHQIELQMWQIKGLEDAFNNQHITNSKELSLDAFKQMQIDPFGIMSMQLDGDMADLMEALGSNKMRIVGDGACSVLIKLLPNNADLYVSHDTWTEYPSMLRVLKRYEFNFALTADENSAQIPSNKMSFSSYPSIASSGDDFYLMESGLATVETTNGNYNDSLWSIVRNGAESGVFEFLRVQVANRLAKTGAEWVQYFSDYNSGTYNNQWMVVDYNRFTPGKEIPDTDVLYVAEQIPGNVESQDMTASLKKNTYWASYNIPAFQSTFDTCNYKKMVDLYGEWFTHEGSPRAKIFKRDHAKVVDEESMIKLMRYNDFQRDPLSQCNCTPPFSAENAIAARNDLNPANGVYPFSALGHRNHGATDMKMVNYKLLQSLNFVAESGPTHDTQPVFQWSRSDFNTSSHLMHPDRFDFKPIKTPF